MEMAAGVGHDPTSARKRVRV